MQLLTAIFRVENTDLPATFNFGACKGPRSSERVSGPCFERSPLQHKRSKHQVGTQASKSWFSRCDRCGRSTSVELLCSLAQWQPLLPVGGAKSLCVRALLAHEAAGSSKPPAAGARLAAAPSAPLCPDFAASLSRRSPGERCGTIRCR